MPCDSSYMEATPQEAESKRVAELLSYILPCIGEKVDEAIELAADDYYGNKDKLDEWTARLCQICGDLDEDQQSEYLYDGTIKSARRLADWWEDHQEQDRRRKEDEDSRRPTAEQLNRFANDLDEFINTEEGAEAIRKFYDRKG